MKERIKPLVWHIIKVKDAPDSWVAETVVGTYEIFRTPSGNFVVCFDGATIDATNSPSTYGAAVCLAWNHHCAIVSQLVEP